MKTEIKNKTKKKIIQFRSSHKSETLENNLDMFDIKSPMNAFAGRSKITNQRKIPKQAYKILDAPGLQDDFYLNL